MGKKCIPGLFCIENMTLFLLIVIFVLLIYVWYTQLVKPYYQEENANKPNIVVLNTPPLNTSPVMIGGISTRQDPFNDPYAPPMKTDGLFYPPDSGDIRGIPVNIRSRRPSINTGYQQIGILTRSQGNSDIILPLMGRRIMTGRDKWQYYTISNSGNINTKLPISVNGKSCTSEYGCDDINNGDVVYVEGYKDTFIATVYENNLFQYIPF